MEKVFLSFDAGLMKQIHQAAANVQGGVSAWLAEATRTKLGQESLGVLLKDDAQEHGTFTATKLREIDTSS